MNNTFKHRIKQYLSFSKKDRNAIIILCILILVMIGANIIINFIEVKSDFDYSEFETALAEWEKNQPDEKSQNYQFLFDFNPNTISEKKLDSLLLPDIIKRNLLNYRKANGIIKSTNDFKKIYGMNDSIFHAIENYIIIPENKVLKIETENELKKSKLFITRNDSIKNQTELKIVSEIIELNSADSLELVLLRGIGSVFASRIIKYRNLLGGFNSEKQLLEVYNFPEETFNNIRNKITADTLLVKKIRINFAEYKELLRHPYFNKEQVESILDYREKNGAYKTEEEIYIQNLVDSVNFQRIRPYITCR